MMGLLANSDPQDPLDDPISLRLLNNLDQNSDFDDDNDFESQPSNSNLHDLTLSKRFRWWPQPLSESFKWFHTRLGLWIKPKSPRRYRLQSWYEFQTPTLFMRIGVCGVVSTLLLFWVLLFGIVLATNTLWAKVPGYGAPLRVSCISRLWPNDGKDCGVNGQQCLPFDNSSFAFRCPADCGRVKAWDPYFVGSTLIHYHHLIIGGASSELDGFVYRGDSHICGAAIHAGIIHDKTGGCGILRLIGERANYTGSTRHGMSSVNFNSSFPLSFTFDDSDSNNGCKDPRWLLLSISLPVTVLLSVLTQSVGVFFHAVTAIIYVQVALATDLADKMDFATTLQMAISRFLPAAFLAFVLYRYCVLRTLKLEKVPIERTVLWLSGCWVGALENYTIDRLPLRRLTPRDLHDQPGAVFVLVGVLLLLLPIVVGQILAFRAEGRLSRYLRVYALFAMMLAVLSSIPGMHLRLHHYIIALLLLPGTSIQTRLSFLYQGLLVGLLINGIARWGFASILETDATLFADGQVGTALPDILRPLIEGANITFNWNKLAQGWDGISVKVNDVERMRWFEGQGVPSFLWTRVKDECQYFRFGYVKKGFINGFTLGDYNSPGTWERNGSWTYAPD